MVTLARQLGETAPASLIVRKASRLGVSGLESAIALAAARGCRHYLPESPGNVPDPGQAALPDDELTLLLIAGEQPYDPNAIRCAAQLARSPGVDPGRLARLAMAQKSGRVLAHIARAGVRHDHEGRRFWEAVLSALPGFPEKEEPDLPHWSRFVSMPGIQRNGPVEPRWLTPRA